jgi:hypothetical protein
MQWNLPKRRQSAFLFDPRTVLFALALFINSKAMAIDERAIYLHALVLPLIKQICTVRDPNFHDRLDLDDEIVRNPVSTWGQLALWKSTGAACMKAKGVKNGLTEKTCRSADGFAEELRSGTFGGQTSKESQKVWAKQFSDYYLAADYQAAYNCLQQDENRREILNAAAGEREQIFKSYRLSAPLLVQQYIPYQLDEQVVSTSQVQSPCSQPCGTTHSRPAKISSTFTIHLPNETGTSMEVWIGYRTQSAAHLVVAYLDNRSIHGNSISTDQFDTFVRALSQWKEAAFVTFPDKSDAVTPMTKKWNEGFVGLLSYGDPNQRSELKLRGWEIFGVPDDSPGPRLSRLQVELAKLRGFDPIYQEKSAQEQLQQRLQGAEYGQLAELMEQGRLEAFREILRKPRHIQLGQGVSDGMPDYGLFFNALKRKDTRFAQALLEAGLPLLNQYGVLQLWVRKQFTDQLMNNGYQRTGINNMLESLKIVMESVPKSKSAEVLRQLNVEIDKELAVKR